MRFNIELTWSKIIAFVMLILCFLLSLKYPDYAVQIWTFTIPFVVGLISVKQGLDTVKKNIETKNNLPKDK